MIESSVVEEYGFKEPEIHEVKYLHDDIFKDCRKKFFHAFEYKLVYDNNFTKLLIMKESVSQLVIDLWDMKLNSMV